MNDSADLFAVYERLAREHGVKRLVASIIEGFIAISQSSGKFDAESKIPEDA